jgi:hypothetical protein
LTWSGNHFGSVRVRFYDTGTVMVSDTVESSDRVMVASPNSTSITVAVHMSFGHESSGATGATVARLNRNWPFLGVGWGPVEPAASKSKL